MDARRASLLFGGDSEERLVSVASAQNLAHAYLWKDLFFFSLDGFVHQIGLETLLSHQDAFHKKFEPLGNGVPFDNWLAQQDDSDVFFLGFHGGNQENGFIQKIFESKGFHFTGSGSGASELCFDKNKTKNVLSEKSRSLGMSENFLARSEVFDFNRRIEIEKSLSERLRRSPLVLKPNRSGSSVGLYFVRDDAELANATAEISKSAVREYVVEDFISGVEVTVGVLDRPNQEALALPATEVVLDQGRHFDYEGKYSGAGTQEVTPARVSSEAMSACQRLAIFAHQTLGCRGYSRTDMILTEAGPQFLETNTLPGLTRASFIPQQLRAANVSLTQFIRDQLVIAELGSDPNHSLT